MIVWLKYNKWIACLCLLAASVSVTAQEKTADIEQLRKDMYRLFNKPDSIDKFMQVTDQLIEVSKQKNNEELLYKAWANQAIMFSLVGKRQQALDIIKVMSDYARNNDSKYGLFISTQANAHIASGLRMEDQAEELYLRCINSYTCHLHSPAP